MKRKPKVTYVGIPQEEQDRECQAMYDQYDTAGLTKEERLGLAYCRFNSGLWDDIFSSCPEGFYELPLTSDKPGVLTRRTYTAAPREQIRKMLSEAQRSMYWWKFAVGKTEEEWRRWYYIDRPRELAEMKWQHKRRERIKELVKAAASGAGLGVAIGAIIGALLWLAT